MSRYTSDDYINMVRCYENSNHNSREAARRYSELYPNSESPCSRTILLAVNRLAMNGNVEVRREGVDNSQRDHEDVREVILEYIQANPEASIGGTAAELNLCRTFVHTVLQQKGLFPYKKLRVQKLHSDDPRKRLQFCQWVLQQENDNPGFSSKILFTNECTFTNSGHFNHHNVHYWATENPRVIDTRRSVQRQFKINVWAGIISDKMVGPHEFTENLNSGNYVEFLEQDLPGILRTAGVNAATRQIMWFQQDGAPAHTSNAARQKLGQLFPNRVRSKWKTVEWPPRSPDLNPLDFFLWGCIKDKVYFTAVESREELMERINSAVGSVTPEMLQRTTENFLKRCRLCVQHNSRHFKQDRRIRDDGNIDDDVASSSEDDDPDDPAWRPHGH